MQEVDVLQREGVGAPKPSANVHLPLEFAQGPDQVLHRVRRRAVQEPERAVETGLLSGKELVLILSWV